MFKHIIALLILVPCAAVTGFAVGTMFGFWGTIPVGLLGVFAGFGARSFVDSL